MTTTSTKDYEYRRGHIEVLDASRGHMRCGNCGSVWTSNLRGGGLYYRGAWTCDDCGANSKGGFSQAFRGDDYRQPADTGTAPEVSPQAGESAS